MTYLIYLTIILLLFLSALFAGSETGVYRFSHIRLRIGVEKGSRSHKVLSKLIRDSRGLILSLLLGNNLVNYFLTTLVTVIILQKTTQQNLAEIYATAILTPIVFIFGELIPKNLFYHHSDTLLPYCSWLLWLFDRIFTYTGVKWLVKFISKVIALCFRLDIDLSKVVDATKRHQVHQIIYETREEGILTETQRQMMIQLIDVPDITVGKVMIPLNEAVMTPIHTSRKDLLEHLRETRYTRQLVYKDNPNQVLGYISILDVLGTEQPFETLAEHVLPIIQIKKNCPVIKAIDLMRSEKARIGLVVEKRKYKNAPIGIITLTDLIEEIIGELNT